MGQTTTRAWWAFVLLGLLAGAGSGSFSIGGQSVEDAALELIDGELTDQVGLGTLDSTCDEVADPEVGTTFECQSTTSDGESIVWDVEVDREDHIDVNSRNLVTAAALPEFETAGVEALFPENNTNIVIECGDEAVVLNSKFEMLCAISDDTSSDVYDATFTVPDPGTGQFEVQIGDSPR